MKAIGELLQDVLKDLGNNRQMLERFIFWAWSQAVGKNLAARSQPRSLSDRALLVALPNREWENQLMSVKAQMISKINAMLPEPLLEDIIFVIDENLPVQAIEAKIEREAESQGDLTRFVEEKAIAIRDLSLRRLFVRAATRNLTLQTGGGASE